MKDGQKVRLTIDLVVRAVPLAGPTAFILFTPEQNKNREQNQDYESIAAINGDEILIFGEIIGTVEKNIQLIEETKAE